MKKMTFGIIGLSVSLLAAGALLAQSGANKTATPTTPEKQQKLVLVSTIKTIQANQEFQANVQLLQTQRQQVIEANAAVGKETNAAKKKDLKAKLDALMAKLNENNDKMKKTYGFSLDRNYTIVVETAHIYMFVSDEEAAKFEKEQAATAKK
jgi:uncharacterized FlaG/YvyC family protein